MEVDEAGMSGELQAEGGAEIAAADARWWKEELAADGLSADRVRLVRRAAEGFAAAIAYGDETPADAAEARRLLLHLASGGELE